jgi:hypothetical protein
VSVQTSDDARRARIGNIDEALTFFNRHIVTDVGRASSLHRVRVARARFRPVAAPHANVRVNTR